LVNYDSLLAKQKQNISKEQKEGELGEVVLSFFGFSFSIFFSFPKQTTHTTHKESHTSFYLQNSTKIIMADISDQRIADAYQKVRNDASGVNW